ncbi:hypothetical protein JCM3774_000139 [Rhodotorula dairenensis]
MPQSLSRAATLSLVALTLHYACFSIVLHISRSDPAARYNALSASFLAEVVKTLASIGLVAVTGELHDVAMQSKRLREEQRVEAIAAADRAEEEGRRLRAIEEEKQLWAKIQEGGEARLLVSTEETAIPVQLHRRSSSSITDRKKLSPKLPKANLSINVALAQGKAPPARAPSFALIPATPAPIPSPTRTPDVSALHPDRLAADSTTLTSAAKPAVWYDMFERDWWRALRDGLVTRDLWQLAVLACLFCFQGKAQFLASGHLSVPVFLLAYQLKIPATAISSVYLMDRIVTRQQWIAVLILATGVGLVQLERVSAASSASSSTPLPLDGSTPNHAIGVAALVAACISSGIASLLFERVLKAHSPMLETPCTDHDAPAASPAQQMPLLSTHNTPAGPVEYRSVWIRNIQLGVCGLAVSVPFVLWNIGTDFGPLDMEDVEPSFSNARLAKTAFDRFFDGFDRPLPWLVVILQAVGGLLNALVMRHADNILKCYSISLSIVLSFAACIVLFQYKVSTCVLVGCILVLVSTWTYARGGR